MRDQARVAVIGGGNMGASVLYHLAKEGWTDCVLIEKVELTSGATWHAAGLVSRMVGGLSLGTLHDYAVALYKTIEQETGRAVSWHSCGSLRVATSPDHMDWISHLYDCVRARGQDIRLISRDEVKHLNPLYDIEAVGILGAVYTPDDGHVDPAGACFAMCAGARQMGAQVVRYTRVTDVNQRPSGEWEVITDKGAITCEHVVNAGGYHAKQIGRFSGLNLPITTIQHHYIVTEDVPEFEDMDHEIPVTRDDYFSGYLRREQKGGLIGIYDKQNPQPAWLDGCPWESENELFEPNWEGITPWLQRCFERFPKLMDLGIKRTLNGGITYTPDGVMILGPAPGLKNYWLACGATAGIAWGPGAGRMLAQWMVHGGADVSTRAFDPRRFGIWVNSEYARQRCIEDYKQRNSLPYPAQQKWTMRDLKTSGVHTRTKALGAVYEEAGGWERPRFYALDRMPAEDEMTYGRGKAFTLVRDECEAARERVGLGDLSAFARFEISGPDAEAYLNRICANRIPKRIGGITLTQILNVRGRIEGEATVAKLADEGFYVVTGATSERRIWDWLTVHQRRDEELFFENRTDQMGILILAGPKARDVLAVCTSDDVSNDEFKWLTAKRMKIGGVDCLALRVSFTGSLAFELHCDNSKLGDLWDALWAVGEPHGMRAFGSWAIDSLRLEKAYRGGQELGNDATPVDAGLQRLVKMDKDFIGKEAIAKQLDSDSTYRLELLEVDVEDHDAHGGEAVLSNGKLVGSVTSGRYAFHVGKSLAMAYLKTASYADGSPLAIIILGKEYPARVLSQPPYDPQNVVLRA